MRWRSLRFRCRLVPPPNLPPNLNRLLPRNQRPSPPLLSRPHPGRRLQRLPATPIWVATGGIKNKLSRHVSHISLLILWLVLAAQNIKCETRLRDKCKGATCNRSGDFLTVYFAFIYHARPLQYQLTLVYNSFCRFNCPANCLNKKGKVWGTLFYDVVSHEANIFHHAGSYTVSAYS